jgi:hypothetical protein
LPGNSPEIDHDSEQPGNQNIKTDLSLVYANHGPKNQGEYKDPQNQIHDIQAYTAYPGLPDKKLIIVKNHPGYQSQYQSKAECLYLIG